MGMFFASLKLNVYFFVLTYDRRVWSVWSMLMIKDGEIPCYETNIDMFLLKVNFSSAKNWREGSTFPVISLRLLHVSFSNTLLAHLSVNTRSPPYSFKRFGLFTVTFSVAILMSWHLLMTPPAILVPNAMSLTFFTIPESNRLSFPILLITVQSPSLYLFFQVLTVVLIFRIFNSELFNCWSSTKISCRQANFFLNLRRNFDLIFFWALLRLLHLLFSVSKLRRSNIFCH